ncbi:MAG: hypothetical protein ACI9VR_004276 [Cognaticolwellia sp.]|jgi:hypothetical protein
MLWAWLACTPEPALVPLDDPRLLRRLSLDLRGMLPSEAALDAVEKDPQALNGIRADYLEEPAFEERLVHIFAESWHTRVESYYIFHTEFQHLDSPEMEHPFEASIGEEPLRLLAHVVAHDRPWAEVVHADYSFANPLLASIWPVAWEDGDTGWQKTYYTDGRPTAGVLSSNGLWWRYQTTLTGNNRGRANAISRLLVCDDYAARQVNFEDLPPLSDEAALEAAIKTVPTCTSCHATLDPIASTLFGFWVSVQDSVTELSTYHLEREAMGPVLLEVEPAWFGTPVRDLEGLGHAISLDPRFSQCAIEPMAQATWRRPVDPIEDLPRMQALQQVYGAHNGQLKQVILALTQTPEYQAGAFGAAATDHQRETERTIRMLTPAQLKVSVEGLTGFVWMDDGFDQMDNDKVGYRTLPGGLDGRNTTVPLHTPSLSTTLVAQRLAEGAAFYVMAGEPFAVGGLLDGTDLTSRPGDRDFDAALERLAWRTQGIRPEKDQVQDLGTLWLDLEALGGTPTLAWQGTLSALLRDPAFLSY